MDAPGVGVQVSGGDDDHVVACVLVGSSDSLVRDTRPVDVIDKEGQTVTIRAGVNRMDGYIR